MSAENLDYRRGCFSDRFAIMKSLSIPVVTDAGQSLSPRKASLRSSSVYLLYHARTVFMQNAR